MKPETRKERTCPICGKTYTEPPALSRTDNKTLICSDCATREALDSIGVDEKEQHKILHTIHKYQGAEATKNGR